MEPLEAFGVLDLRVAQRDLVRVRVRHDRQRGVGHTGGDVEFLARAPDVRELLTVPTQIDQPQVFDRGAEVDELTPIALYMTATRANALVGWSVSGITVR